MITLGAAKKKPKKMTVAAKPVPVTVDPVALEIRRGLVPTLSAMQTRAASRDPGTSGRLALKWTILPDGTVRNLYVEDTTIASEPFRRNVAALIAHWRFPTASESRDVSYPFVFA